MNKYSPDNFETFLKDKTKQYMVYPSDEVWNKIDNKLHPKKFLAPLFISLLILSISSGLILMNTKGEKIVLSKPGQIAYGFIEKDPIKSSYTKLENIKIVSSTKQKRISSPITKFNTSSNQDITNIEPNNQSFSEILLGADKIELPSGILNSNSSKAINPHPTVNADRKNLIVSTIESVIAKAKIIGKNAQWQFYVTPSVSYRRLEGKATSSTYQYTGFPYSTNSFFARDVNDAVRQNPDIGFEIGTAMRYPLTNKLSLKTGLQFNYNQYQTEAYSGVPVVATYGMNSFGFGGRTPINTVSIYSNTDGYRKTTLNNEHILLSMPIGLEYEIAGNKKINLSIASSIQPSYLIGNNSYLISTNLKNYAKEPSLSRRWNLNTAVEASVNFQSGSYRWSIAPQYRYQLLSSYKNKYPIKENLFDLGLKFGVIKTIR
jgi:hypothetical protein